MKEMASQDQCLWRHFSFVFNRGSEKSGCPSIIIDDSSDSRSS